MPLLEVIILRSPLTRMLATLIIEYLIRKGFLAQGDLSQSVDDAINIIGFIAMTLTLLIWQWRAHHPAKAQLDVELPMEDATPQQIADTKRGISNFLEKILSKFIERPPQDPPAIGY